MGAVVAAAAEVGAVGDGPSGSVDIRHERVATAADARLQHVARRRERRGVRHARDVRRAGGVDRDPEAGLAVVGAVVAAEHRREDEARARAIELRDERAAVDRPGAA
jgi:hypothetical protein